LSLGQVDAEVLGVVEVPRETTIAVYMALIMAAQFATYLSSDGTMGHASALYEALLDRGDEFSHTWLVREGLVSKRRKRRRADPCTVPFAECDGPNALWCIDFKGWFATGDGTRCNPLTITDAYSRFEQVYVCHGVREVSELAYRDFFPGGIHDDPLVGDEAKAQLHYYPTVTREPFERQGRFTDLIASGQLFRDLGLDGEKFNPDEDRIMLCGSMDFIKDMGALMETHGMVEGSNAEPGDYVLERAFVG
jgi:hypothetical protein